MSATYSMEPTTSGKVVLETTKGEIEIELWAKEMPLASRNFVQLCMENYFDNTQFHRIIPGFMVQGGDPTNTGAGGESVYTDGIEGKYFKDEFHTRISFNRRGLLACANQSKPNTNGSQFFITLAACRHLDGKHTIFGKIVGPTMFNVLQMENLEIGEDDRPVYPPKILSTKVVRNPFGDIQPRKRGGESTNDGDKKDKPNRSRRKRKRVKNLGLLSFGEEEEELLRDDEKIPGASGGIKSLQSSKFIGKARRKEKRGGEEKSKKKRVDAETPLSNDIMDSKSNVENPTVQPDRNTGGLLPLSRLGVNQAGKCKDALPSHRIVANESASKSNNLAAKSVDIDCSMDGW
eukprot:g1392.t1